MKAQPVHDRTKFDSTTHSVVTVQSSFIQTVGYDPGKRTATVQFRSGSVYEYRCVHPTTITRWLKAPSKGRYFHRNIRRRYETKRIQ